jgi:hypothetical protein
MIRIVSLGAVLLAILFAGFAWKSGIAQDGENSRFVPSTYQIWAEKKADLELARKQFGKSHPRVIYLQTQLEAIAGVQGAPADALPENFDRETLLKTIRQLQQEMRDMQQRLDKLEKPKATGRFDDQA